MSTDKDPRFKYFDGITWAVFNCHECDMRKGRKAVLEKYGKRGWLKVLAVKRTGIMAIFQFAPTPETKLYATTVALSADNRAYQKRQRYMRNNPWVKMVGRSEYPK